MATETKAILAADGITQPDLSKEAKAALPPESYEITERELEECERPVYDKHLIFSIDPATAKGNLRVTDRLLLILSTWFKQTLTMRST